MNTLRGTLFCATALGACVLATCAARADGPAVSILPIGAQAPDFCLPGIDGQTHCLKDYVESKVLVVVFTCNHCPTAQLYEQRIRQLAADYEDKGVALVAIEPNNPNAVRLDEMGYTDVGASLDDMKIRAPYPELSFPYFYAADTQT